MLVDRRVFRRLVQARDLLATDDRPIREIASAVAISPFHFIRQFEAVFGTTPHQFRTELRLAHAKRLLARGTPVTEVCMEVGFSSLGSFSSLFARRVGMPPSAFRRVLQVTARLQTVPGCVGLLGELPADAFRNFREAARA
jgi:AraC-like DNA-binding protein